MTVGYSELTFCWNEDGSGPSYFLRLLGVNDDDVYEVEVGNDMDETSVRIPIDVFYEMAKRLPYLEQCPEPLPYAEEAE